MKIHHVQTDSAMYNVYFNEVDPRRPLSLFLHGGPGFNCHAERNTLGPLLHPRVNFLWFDLLGAGESIAHRPEAITWQNQIDDIATIVRRFTDRPVNVIGHCLGVQISHDLVEQYRGLIRSLIWYSPVLSIPGVFKGMLRRAIDEKLLDRKSLSKEQVRAGRRFLITPDRSFGRREVLAVLQMAGEIDGYQKLYWSNREVMDTYARLMSESPFKPEIFTAMQSDYFEHRVANVPDCGDIPIRVLWSDDDRVTPCACADLNRVAVERIEVDIKYT